MLDSLYAVLNKGKTKVFCLPYTRPPHATMNNAQGQVVWYKEYMNQFNDSFVKKPDNTAEGLREARKDFDFWLGKQGVSLQ